MDSKSKTQSEIYLFYLHEYIASNVPNIILTIKHKNQKNIDLRVHTTQHVFAIQIIRTILLE